MKIYLICTVRIANAESKEEADKYVASLEAEGHTVHYPPRDVDQTDDGIGLAICEAHRIAVRECDEVHVLWNTDSKGSHFDFGMAWALGKPIKLVNAVSATPHKSYSNVLREISCE